MLPNGTILRIEAPAPSVYVGTGPAKRERVNVMRFVNPLPFVKDIEASKRFYRDVVGLSVLEDHGNFVRFNTGFAIHDGASLARTIWNTVDPTDTYGRQNLLLYFETDDLDAAFADVSQHAEIIHPVETQAWGQRVFRFYDPDGHAVEIGEPQ